MEGLRKYTIPILGALTSGKSTLINGIFLNNSILEVGMSHTTKFICIIRHENKLAKGKYRFTKVKIGSNSLLKAGNTIEDEDSIKNKIIEINKKDIISKDISNEFYLLETYIQLINDTKENDELLKDIDFLEIPGLDFFESKQKNKNEIETNKISNIFKNLKDKLKYFIIVFDCLRLHHDSVFTILEIIKKELNIDLINDLIIINKANLMPEKTYDKVKEYFIQELLKKPDIINYNKNMVLPLNAEKIILQQQYKRNFKSFIKYLYYLFCEHTLEIGPSEENYFLNYIIKYINRKKEELKIDNFDISNIVNFETEIKPALEQIYTNIYHSEQIKNIKVEEKEEFFNEINKEYFCELFYLYSNNLIEYNETEYNEAKQEITNYLIKIHNNKENNKENEKDKFKKEINEKKNQNLLLIQKLDEFMKSNILTQFDSGNINLNRDFYKILKEINQRKNLLVNAFLNTQFRISVVGLSSAGKSYFINCLIGKEILETGSGDTTQFGIIIENHDSDEVSLCRARYKYISEENEKKYLIFEKDNESFVNGFDNVKRHLLLLNKNKIHQEKDIIQDNYNIFRFWILKIRIAMCQFKNFNIQIIDFPGLGTSMKYIEEEIFQNLLSTSNIIFHVIDYTKIGQADKEISNRINKYINDFRLDPHFAINNTLYILNKLNPLVKEDNVKYKEKLSKILGFKKDLINYIIIINNFYNDVNEVKNFTFSSYLKKNYERYIRLYKSKYSDFKQFYNIFNKINDNKSIISNIDNKNQIIKDKAIEEFKYVLSKEDKEAYEEIICKYINNDENFKNNILYFYIREKINLDNKGTLRKMEILNNFIIEKFYYNKEYFKAMIEEFTSSINKLLENIINSRSILKEDLDYLKSQFNDAIIKSYSKLGIVYNNNFKNLNKILKNKLQSLKLNMYKSFFAIDKTGIRNDIQDFFQDVFTNFNTSNNKFFNILIQNELCESLKKIIINYEEKRKANKEGKKIEFNEFTKFIENNIKIIENENSEIENVEVDEGNICDYSENEKNNYLERKFKTEENKLKYFFDILMTNVNKQQSKYIKEYLMKLSSFFGDYNNEEKTKINLIKTELNNIINDLFQSISDYHLYAEKSIRKDY